MQRAYSWAPRWLAHINRLPLTVKRTFDVQLSRGFEQSATILQPASICCFLLNIQNVSPAHAPSLLMTVSCTPRRKSRTEQAPASGDQIPTINSLLIEPGAVSFALVGPAESANSGVGGVSLLPRSLVSSFGRLPGAAVAGVTATCKIDGGWIEPLTGSEETCSGSTLDFGRLVWLLQSGSNRLATGDERIDLWISREWAKV